MSIINKISRFFRNNSRSAVENEDKTRVHVYIGKFITQSGIDIGESIAVVEKGIIVKSRDDFLSIPFEKIITNAEKITVGDFNREESLQYGKEWFDRKDTLEFDEKGMMILSNPKPQ